MRIAHALVLGLWMLSQSGCVTVDSTGASTDNSPTDAAQANVDLGVGYYRQGNLPQAQLALERAVELDPKLPAAQSMLALVYEASGDVEAAERHYRRSVALAPRDPDALESLAIFLCRQSGRREDALEVFDEAAAIPLSVAYTDKGSLLTNAGVCAKPLDLARAEEYLRRALRLRPNYAEALLQLADVAYKRKDYLPARAFLQRYTEVQPATPPTLWLGMQIEEALGATAAAGRLAAELKSSFPRSAEARQLLERERGGR